MIQVEVVEDFADCPSGEWNSLLATNNNPLPFQRYEWIKCWWENFGCSWNKKIFILLARDNGKLIGVAPLFYGDNRILNFKLIKFIGSGFFDYLDFILERGREKEILICFLNYLKQTVKNFEIKLQNLIENSVTFKFLKEPGLNSDFSIYLMPSAPAPYLLLPGDKQSFFLEIKKSLRLDISRQKKRLSNLGMLKFKKCTNLSEAQSTLTKFFYLHIKKWEYSKGYSVYKFAKWRFFLESLLRELFKSEIANMYYLSVGENKIAACFSFEMKNRFLYYMPTYDPQYARYSPGKVLLSELINFSIDDKFQEFDFGIGKENYKLEWPCKIRKISCLSIIFSKNKFIFSFLLLRNWLTSKYFLDILPLMRKFSFLVGIWRWWQRRVRKGRDSF